MRLDKRRPKFWAVLKQKLQGEWRVTVTSLGLAGLVVSIRLVGLLQVWELAALDQLIRLRPPEPVDDRIVIVGIDEADLRSAGQYPMSDRQMAQLLQKLQAAKPRAIGLDIYRDIPVEPGHQQLQQVYRKSPNLIGISHIKDDDSPEVPPPPVLRDTRQYGFNNVVLDPDNTVRRGLLYWKPHDHRAVLPSFALSLAFLYLSAEGIRPIAAPSGEMQLGKALFDRFTGDDGGYVLTDSGGYQILLNPRGPANTFRRVTMTEVMQGRVPAAALRDRIVLIGYTAVSLNDFANISYSSRLVGPPQPVPGIELQANIVSQILGAATDGRVLFQSWPEPMEWLWIGAWAWLGGMLCWRVRSLYRSTVTITVAGLSLVAIGYAALLVGWWIPTVSPVLAMAGSAIATIAYIARRQEELQRSKEFLQTIINTIPDPIFVKDQQHQWVVLNAAFSRFSGYPLADLLERSDYEVFPTAEADIFRQQDELVFKTGQEHHNEEAFTDRSGFTHQIETKRSLHKDAAGNLFLVGIIRDITHRKQLEEELKRTTAELVRSNTELLQSANHLSHLANHDSLTGLPNRKYFYEHLEQAIDWAKNSQQLVGLLFLDLDGFKQINDVLGHDMGDALLKAVARRLTGCLRSSDTVARLGGDEFTVILPAIPSAEDAIRVAEKVLFTLSQTFVIQAHTIIVTSSVGISLFPTHAQDLEDLVKEADSAMYRAKQRGKNCYEIAPSVTNH